ncbi:hypothetical protein RJ640_009133 [Escallonia rubra]|uniref:N-acetyltransferase domain-containing protein n=1 Tax=Escallonia rubra TaxID=112253 RepID=A0AA88QQ30_9ASTE|nr:hypothetical protein RJ640_009133 [Escallonia rubra]
MASSKLRSSCSFPNMLLSFFNFLICILSAASLAPVIFLKMPPTSMGWALLMVSSISLISSFVGFYSQLMHCCFLTHISLLLASSIGQLLAILSLFTKEKSSLSMLKSPRDPREAKLLVRLECGVLMAMFVMQLGVLALTCAVHSCWVREYEGIEAEREKTARRRSRRIARVQEESMANVAQISDSKAKELDEKMKTKYGQWLGATEVKAKQVTENKFKRPGGASGSLASLEDIILTTTGRGDISPRQTEVVKSLNSVHGIDKDIQISRKTNVKCSQTRKKEELSLETREKSVSHFEEATPTNLKFDRLQLPDQNYVQENKVEFGDFVAREAVLDEEYWTAAWLRAETHWENRNDRYVDNYKRKFAEQEFNAIKRQCKGQFGQKCSCIVAVKKEESNVKRTVLKSVVGTLDFNIRYLLTGETFPGERVKAPIFCRTDRQAPRKYGYVANLCVAKSARRQGIASNMLNLAILSAKSNGAEQVFVHVYRSNVAAQELYEKMGFEVVQMASQQQSKEKTYLLCFGV